MALGDEEGGRSPSRKAAAKKADNSQEVSRPAERSRGLEVSAPQAMRSARRQLAELLGREPESVSAVKRTSDGWQADVEVVELVRVPDTTSVMASYRVTLGEEGQLIEYEQTRRYSRGQTDRRS